MKIEQCTITLTRNCNLKCNFCYAKETGYISNEQIELEDLKRIVDLCNDAKVKYIVLTGGEPTLYPYILEALQYIKSREHKMIPTIATNGVKLNNFEYCKALVESGLEYIDVSLKGKDAQECYELVGQECFSQQMKAIQNLSKLSIEFTCSIVITHKNVDTFCETVKKAYDFGARQFSFTLAVDNNTSMQRNEQYLEKHNPFLLIQAFLAKSDELNTITKGEWWVEYTFPICAFTEKQLDLLKGRMATPCQIYNRNAITFDAKMKLLPCSMNIGNNMGEFGKDFNSYEEFKIIAQSDPYKGIMDSLNKLPSNKCLSCKFLEKCRGGCTIFWKNFSYDAFYNFKQSYYQQF